MRRTRWLLLILFVVLSSAVGFTYWLRRMHQQRESPPLPPPLPQSVSAKADDWRWRQTGNGHPTVEVRAKGFQQITEPSRYELTDVELRVFARDGQSFNRVRCARAEFDIAAGILFSPGDVEILIGVPAEGSEPPDLLKIRSSGVRFDNKSGTIFTDRPASFAFRGAQGRSTGAEYRPDVKELRLLHDVELQWRGRASPPRPMVVRAASLLYKEQERKIFLSRPSELLRQGTHLQAADSVVTLAGEEIELVEALQAHGVDRGPDRALSYQAERLWMHFAPGHHIQRITGEGQARLHLESKSGQTTVTSARLDLHFTPQTEDSVLSSAEALGSVLVFSRPATKQEARELRTEAVALKMRSGGREMERVETHAPAFFALLPEDARRRKRFLNGERMSIDYAGNNLIRTVSAYRAVTRTEATLEPGKAAPPPAITSSKELTATFEPQSGELTRLEQWEDFRYEQGERKARSYKAVLEPQQDRITLSGRARVWDPSGWTEADALILQESSGDLAAEGHVRSTRQADVKSEGALLGGKGPVNAQAARMITSKSRSVIIYSGEAVLWQGANRLQAQQVRIDRAERRLEAEGSVITQIVEGADAKQPDKAPLTTVVRAPQLVYTEADQLAHYFGGVRLERPGITMTGKELRAFLIKREGETRLEKAIADGDVRVIHIAAARTRTGTGDHAEYYLQDERVHLLGKPAALVDSLKGATRGAELIWFSKEDRLVVASGEQAPAVSTLKRKH